jgi:hypothetical protein
MASNIIYHTQSIISQNKLELSAMKKLEKDIFSDNILCCVPDYSSGELFNYISAKLRERKNRIYIGLSNNGVYSQIYDLQIIGDWDTVIQTANDKCIPTAVCCFYHGEDRVFSKFLKNFKGDRLILISDTALFEEYYGCEIVDDWHFEKDIVLDIYLHMMVFTRAKESSVDIVSVLSMDEDNRARAIKAAMKAGKLALDALKLAIDDDNNLAMEATLEAWNLAIEAGELAMKS